MLDILRKRRSVRKFTERKVEEEKVNDLLEAVLRSPSSMNRRPCSFVVITEPEICRSLAHSKAHGAAFLEQTPLIIAVVADPDLCDVWVEDASIASFVLHATATDLGLGSCWVQIRKRVDAKGVNAEENVRKILNLPAKFRVEALIGIGYSSEEKAGHDSSSLLQERIHWQSYKA